MQMNNREATVAFTLLAAICAVLSGLTRAPMAFAQSSTVVPTKAPYIFPTPLFIPVFPYDTPAASRATATLSSAPAQPAAGGQTYAVQSGDSLWTIAQKVYGNGAKYPLIANANNITTGTRLRTGMVLSIPAAAGAVPATPTSLVSFPTIVPTMTPTITPTALPLPTALPTAVTLIPGSVAASAPMAINLLSIFFFAAAIFFGVMAFLSYRRGHHIELIESGKQPLRIR
jgi:LysM repeat protein